jgi:dihydrofolate reductase
MCHNRADLSQIPPENVVYMGCVMCVTKLLLYGSILVGYFNHHIHYYKTYKMKIIIYLAASANGLISNNRNVPDWLSPEYGEGFMAISQRTQAVIMGKTTYNILAPDYLPLKEEGSLVVLTHDTNATSAQSNVLFTSDSPEQIIAQLAAKGHTEAVIIGGTQTVTAFFEAGLVNEIILVVEPVLFGSGLPLMKEVEPEYQLALLEVKKLNDNTVHLHYEVKGR